MRRTTTLTALAGLALPLGLLVATSAPARAAESCDGSVATIVVPATTAYPPRLVVGTPGDDVIVGSAGDDRIDGGAGNDTICGLAGSDTLLGGEGDDRLFGGLDGTYYPDDDYYGDRIAPGPGDDHVDLGHDPQGLDLWRGDTGYWDQVSYGGATAGVTVDLAAGTATGEGTDTIVGIVHAAGIEGSDHDDVLSGTDDGDWINAGGGDDTVAGRGGRDRIDADQLTVLVSLPDEPHPGDDVVDGGPGSDAIIGGHGADVLRGGDGHDSVRVEDADGTRAYGGPGRDMLGGYVPTATGRARLIGGPGNDLLSPSIGATRRPPDVRGNGGRDTFAPNLVNRESSPRRSRVVVDADAGGVRTKIGRVIDFGSVEVYDLASNMFDTAPLTWRGTGRAETLDMGFHRGPVRAYGGGGADRITGGWRPDLLDGGPGRDRLDGDRGRDRCLRGEQVRRCEARR